jgi:iduronate 2-sulfatase
VRLGKVYHGGIDYVASWSEGADSAPKKKTASKNCQDGNKNQAPSSKAGAALANDDGKPMTEPTGTITDQMRNSDQRIRLSGDGETHGDYRTADAAIAAMERLKDKPFFITCGFTKPHAAPAAPTKFYDLYPAEKKTLPADFAAYPTPPKGFPPAALTKQNIDLFWNREARAEEARLMLQSYRASVSWVDWNVGRVIEQLNKLGLREKTIIVFGATTDTILARWECGPNMEACSKPARVCRC